MKNKTYKRKPISCYRYCLKRVLRLDKIVAKEVGECLTKSGTRNDAYYTHPLSNKQNYIWGCYLAYLGYSEDEK